MLYAYCRYRNFAYRKRKYVVLKYHLFVFQCMECFFVIQT